VADDLDLARAECARAAAEGRKISDACARVIASLYHEGGTSPSASFAAAGVIPADPACLWQDLFGAVYGRMGPDKALADMFRAYLADAGQRGPVSGWSRLWLR
jgi:hypothetical protein